MANSGNSNVITRNYIDSLLIETRYMDSANPTIDYELFGEHFSTPIMTASLSFLDSFLFPGASEMLAKGARAAGAVLWYGAAEEEEVERLAGTGARLIEIIKPFADRDLIYRKIEHAGKLGILAVGIDIDHPFAEDGSPDAINGKELSALKTSELAEICSAAKLPVIVKGVLSKRDADRCLSAGVSGMVLSHHNNRIEYAVPPMAVLPEIAELAGGRVPVFVDGEIKSGMDAFKALALGAKGVLVGRPLMAAIKEGHENGVRDFLKNATAQLRKAMAYTGCVSLDRMDASVIRRI